MKQRNGYTYVIQRSADSGEPDFAHWYITPSPTLLKALDTTPTRGDVVIAGLTEPQPGSGRAVTRCLADVQPESVRWLWPGRIARGKVTLIVGDPGLGKSFATLDIAARVSTGATWPDGRLNKQGSVILLSAEDDAADASAPRRDGRRCIEDSYSRCGSAH